jgi:hypothetical protein
VAQAISTTEFTIVFLSFFRVVALEASACNASLVSLVDFTLCDIVASVL